MQSEKEDISTICRKYDILLTKNKSNDIYTLKFNIKNPNITIPNLFNFSLFKLLGDLNKDSLDRLEIMKQNTDSQIEVLFCFTQFGKELGIPPKYMYCETNRRVENNRIVFYSHSISYPNDKLGKNYSEISSDFSDLYIDILSPHDVEVTYVFKVDIHEDLPIYMENIIGIVMKKTFYRLKVFIENLK
jgi:hypothetical protein